MRTKKTVFYVLGLMSLLVSCKDNGPDIKYKEPQILSFGFYAEDNEGVIAKDYVVDSVTTNSITIDLPEGTNKTALVARFTTNENDTVKVNGTLQTSGTTANDFSLPVDYMLSQGDLYAKYTVTIGKAPAYVWTLVTPYDQDSVVASILKVNPVSGIPFIMYKEDRTNTEDEKAAMIKLDNGAWVNLGEASEGRIGSYYDFTFDANGNPYISYSDYTATTSQMHSVSAFNGTAWSLVGSKGVTTVKASYNSIAFSPDGNLMLFSMTDVAGALAKRELCVSTFDATTWTTNQTVSGRGSDLASYFPTAKLSNGALYLAVYNAVTPNSFSLYKLENGTWSTLADKWRDEAATGMNIRDFDMDVDHDGNVYIAMADNSSDGVTYKHKIVKYTASTGNVSVVGNPFTVVTGNLFNYDLAVSPTGTPYIFYRNENSYPTVSYFDAETQDWSTPYTFETVSASDLSIDFARNGDAYLSYTKSGKLVVYKYAEPQE